MWISILSILSFDKLYSCRQCLISSFKMIIRVNNAFIYVYSRAFTIWISLIMLINFFFSCNMSSFEKFDCDVEKFKSSLKSNYKISFVDCENDISFEVKFFTVEKLFANKTKIFFHKTRSLLKRLSLFEKKNTKRERFFSKKRSMNINCKK